ncbi:hypothetical protein K439DRAFT_1637810 [Ramaria rubella]|nr:hypothetical protein K439DRAFT_1637810 [Ramaria rubella]
MTHGPPDISRAVAHVKVETIIDSPSDVVWNIILDFPAYSKWNSFVRSQVITDSSFKPFLEPPKPSEGAYLLMHVRVPPRGVSDNDKKGLTSTKEIITYVDEESRRISWKQCGIPSWLLRADRWQEVTEEQIDGSVLTKYMTVEVFNGPSAWVIRWFMLKNLTKAFNAMADDLRKRSEALARIQ